MTLIETDDGTELFTLDWGTGERPVVLIHGWPLSSAMWEYQLSALPAKGIRCIAYDRRGFGRSSQPWDGYDYDTLADDLAAVIDAYDLDDVTLVGFSMGGGEVARYMSRHGGERISKAVLLGAVTPFLLQTPDNPDGAPQSVFDGIIAGLKADRPGFLAEFAKLFFGVGTVPSTVSPAYLAAYCNDAMRASGRATLACVDAWSQTDFRADLDAFEVPTLIIHGDKDATVPLELTARKAHGAIPGSELKIYEGAPHGLYFTHKDQLTADIAAFVRR